MKKEKPWFQKCWRRILVDMHIPDWNPVFLSKLDPARHVEMMKLGNASSVMVFANSHVGLCNYPTKTGKMHSGLKGKDFFGEVLKECHKQDLSVVVYYSLIFNNWAYVEHPDWRIEPAGEQPKGRYGTCCPNSDYRLFSFDQIEEICGQYKFESIFFDMTFWPLVCYCKNCTRKYVEEKGKEPPRVINWQGKEWVQFQRMRERWIDSFAKDVTDKVHSINGKVTVTHQFSTVLADWRYAVPFSLSRHCDYLSGDFYGESTQQSVVCKIFFGLSHKRPFEFHTSRCMNLTDHVTMKSHQRMKSQALVATAHSSAFQFIDAINPDGTLNPGVYKQIRSVYDITAGYESSLGGDLCADVAAYFSGESKFNPAETGKDVGDLKEDARRMPHWEAVLGSCKKLQQAHIPFGVLTKFNLADISKYQVLILPDVLTMDEEEQREIADFVRGGGSVYASYRTSLRRKDAKDSDDFLLGDVFGIKFSGEKLPPLNFFTPVDRRIKEWFIPQDHMIDPLGQVQISVRNAEVLAARTLPYTDPDRGDIFGETFSSIHSNPPGPPGKEPSITFNRFGKGMAVYSAGSLETIDSEINKRVFINLIRLLIKEPLWFYAKTHESVEVILFHNHESRRMLISFLNTAQEPEAFKFDVDFSIRIPGGFTPSKLLLLPENQPLKWTLEDNYIKGSVREVDTFAMVSCQYS